MEQHSQTSEIDDYRRILEGQLRECYGRVVYSHKTHEKCADILEILNKRGLTPKFRCLGGNVLTLLKAMLEDPKSL